MGKARDNIAAKLWIVSKTDGNCGMSSIIVQTKKYVTLVGAGEASKDQLYDALRFAPFVVAADGGAQMALNYGITPKMVIGDFDSIDSTVLDKFPDSARFHTPEQNSTDFDKCLSGIDAPLILGVGFLGGRLDHQLAAFNSLVKNHERPCVLIGEHDLVFHLSGKVDLQLEIGSRLSLFPMAPVQGGSVGLQWPTDGLSFAPNGFVGTSNRVVSAKVQLEFFSPGMLVILPRAALAAVIAGFGVQ